MHAMHEIEGQRPDRFGSYAGPVQPDPSPVEPQTAVAACTPDNVSVRLLAAYERDHDTAVLGVHGEIDLETAPVLRTALVPILEHDSGPVVVDLSDVAFMDSTGVHVLIQTLQRLEPQNRRLAIACVEGGPVHRILAVVGLLDTMAVHRSRESALSGGDDLLRSEPGRDSSPSKGRALMPSPPSSRSANGQVPQAS